MNLRNRFFILLTIGVFLTGQWGCATGRYEYPKPEPLSEKYREQLGTIGVVKEAGVPVIQIDKPLPPPGPAVLARMGRGTVEGAGKSWDWWLDLCSTPWDNSNVENRQVGVVIGQLALPVVVVVLVGVCYILTPPVAMFGGLGGGIYGAFPSSPVYPAYVEEIEAFLRDTLAKYPIQENFQSSILKEARARTSNTFVVVPEEGSQTSEGMVGQGVDTLLELSVQRIWLKRVDNREGDMNPPMVFVLFVRAKLMRAAEKTVWYDQTFFHETDSHSYQVWPYYNRVQEATEKAYQNLAEQLVEKLFLPKPSTYPATTLLGRTIQLLGWGNQAAHEMPQANA